jgi:hypothetical protein
MANCFMLSCCALLGLLSVARADVAGGLNLLSLHGGRVSKQTQTDANVHAVGDHTAQGVDGKEKQQRQRHTLLAQPAVVNQQLIICNAYASPKKLEVVNVRTRHSLTEGNPLAYKQCQDFRLPLSEGDQLDFKAGGLDVGTFYATGLPKSSASLLLIPHRRSPHAVSVAFESHAFADLTSPQIAVIDAYRGKDLQQSGSVKLVEDLPPTDNKAEAELSQVEESLRFNSVVAVNPGQYLLSLGDAGGNATKKPLNAVGGNKYVVMRLGVEGEDSHGDHYPQELVVFPNGAMGTSISFSVAVLAFVVAILSLSSSI